MREDRAGPVAVPGGEEPSSTVKEHCPVGRRNCGEMAQTTSAGYSRQCTVSTPILLKSVAGLLPWKPISCHCLERRALRGSPGMS